MTIYFDEEQTVDEVTSAKMQEAASCVCAEEGFDPENISFSVTFVDGEEIKELNRDYRGVDSVTDVLSFPQFDAEEDLSDWPEDEELLIGDVVICTDRAKEQAEEYGHSFERELIYLFVHSLFHLFGYDHMEEEDKAVMRGKEEKVMSLIGLDRESQML